MNLLDNGTNSRIILFPATLGEQGKGKPEA